MGVTAVGIAAAVGGVAATQPASIAALSVDLAALIVVGSSTHPDGAGNEDFFGGLFNQAPYNPGGQPGPDLIPIDFRGGPAAIGQALQANSGEDNAVLASGWGAANASLVLSSFDRRNDPALPTTVFVLDNNVSRPDGGFGTRYPLFALIGVNPFPTPTDTAAAAVIDIAYQYNYNSNAPADLFNVLAHVNSLVAYLYGYRDQSEIALPVGADGTPSVSCGGANTCAVLASGQVQPCQDARCQSPAEDRVTAYVTTRGKTTYVTYTTDELPLARLIRDVVPFGNTIADLTEPVLKLLVDSAYYDGNPISSDPSRYRPARLMPSIGELLTTAAKMPGALREGVEAVSEHRVRPVVEHQDAAPAARTEQRLEDSAETAEVAVETDATDVTTDEEPARRTADRTVRRGKAIERESDSESAHDGPADVDGGRPTVRPDRAHP
ncbi:PE-PPE domain-containing protein [Mycolicibacterium chubuense]|uniref:PE-PPE domain-containing protein n=1 Tax=Mycolicibacterium chubuense TaxID=1800 RepID=UPI00069F85B6|nr:PE-PPE domain-containing protein [Mycolicibacterium chubuense]ORA44077.1 PE-PPE domain-containing protein [Mycolicibacterium chubuense]